MDNNYFNEHQSPEHRIRKTISITQYDQDLINDIKKDSIKFNWAREGEIKDSVIIQRAIRCYHSIIFPPKDLEDLPFS